MADDAAELDRSTATADSIEVGAPELAWAQAWQIPVLLLGLGVLVIGLYFAIPDYMPPDFPGVLADVEVHLKASELELAETKLEKLAADPRFNETASDELKAHKLQLLGDLYFYQIDKRVWQGIATPTGQENLGQIRAQYLNATRLGRELPPLALRRYAQTLVALGEDRLALGIVDQMPTDMDPPRYLIVRDLIERRVQAKPGSTSDDLAQLIARFEQEITNINNRKEKRDQTIWVMALKAERFLLAGDHDAVIQMLVEGGLLSLKQRGATERELAPLTVRLGEAYARSDQLNNARLQLRNAQQHLPDGDPLNARIRVAFGDITLAEGMAGQYEQAYSHYRQAYDSDKLGPSSIEAIVGMAHTEANRDGRFPESLKWFTLAVERMVAGQIPPTDPRRQKLVDYLRDTHVYRAYELGRYNQALALIEAYEPLESPDLSAQTLKTFAAIHQRLGEQSLSRAKELAADALDPSVDPNIEARRLHNQDAAIAFEKAGEYYRRQASQLTHTTEPHGEALWNAAKAFEQAQRWDKAVEVYSDFLDTSDRADRREEASFRIAQALLAEGQAQAAVDRFREIIETAPTGEWAKQSYVPMAQGLAELERWGEAENILRSVTDDHPSIGPDSPFFHDALVALGKLMYQRGSDDPAFYSRAIEVLGSEGGAVERYQHDNRYRHKMPMLRYMLADSLRLSAKGLAEQAQLARTEASRMEKLSDRVRRLSDAQMYYNQVVVEYEPWHPDAFTPTDQQYFRNAQFYQADCAFERGDYETAIGLYLNAVSRWRDHPAALVGWVQIMNARAELGQHEAARSAHARAIELFNQMPEGAFRRADSLMTRERWDDWLQWMTQLDLFEDTTSTAGVPTVD